MRIFDLMLKDLQQIIRDKRSLAFLLVMPIVFTLFMGFALKPAAPGDPRLPVGLVVEDAGVLGQEIEPLMNASQAIRPVRVDAAAAEAQIQKGDLVAALILPADFSAQMMAGSQPQLALIADTLKPEGQSAQQAMQGIVMRLLSAAQAGNLSVQLVKPNETARESVWKAGVEESVSKWLSASVSIEVQQASGLGDPAAKRPVAFAQSSPGMLVMFAMFGLMNASMVLVLERKTRTLQRMLTTSMRRSEIIAGHLLAMFSLVFVQGLILIGFGQLAFGVDYLREPLAVVAVLAAFALWVASLGLLVGAIAKGAEQVTMFSMIAMWVFSALGGAFFPLEGTGQAFATIGKFIPTSWAMTGFQNIVVRGLDFNSVLLPVGILLVYAIAFFGLAVWRFKFE
jgi:ABC-2 type transport system permease protein